MTGNKKLKNWRKFSKKKNIEKRLNELRWRRKTLLAIKRKLIKDIKADREEMKEIRKLVKAR